MDTSQTFFTDDEFQEMTGVDIDSLVHSRLNDLADQVAHLQVEGYADLASLLHAEGMQLAAAADNGDTFIYLSDLALS